MTVGSVYVLGAGFSKTCDIATDAEMLAALEPLLKLEPVKPFGKTNAIASIREQVFDNRAIGFESFMSMLASLKFMGEYMGTDKNIFRESEREIKAALRRYLRDKVKSVDWHKGGKVILRFANVVDWKEDYVLTFNYDTLLEAAAARLGIETNGRITHLHGDVDEKVLAWPTFSKFAYRTQKVPLGPRWRTAFQILRQQMPGQAPIRRIIFIGYSMPQTDLEAKSLFKYADWYNEGPGFTYGTVVVNPQGASLAANFAFLTRRPQWDVMTLEEWLDRR